MKRVCESLVSSERQHVNFCAATVSANVRTAQRVCELRTAQLGMREECEPRNLECARSVNREPRGVRKFPSTCNGCGIRTLPRKQHDAPEVLPICELYAVFLKAQHSANRNALMSICTIRQLPFQRKRTNPAQKRRGIVRTNKML